MSDYVISPTRETGPLITGYRVRDGQVVAMDGGRVECASAAERLRGVVPPSQELAFWNGGGGHVFVELVRGMTHDEILRAAG